MENRGGKKTKAGQKFEKIAQKRTNNRKKFKKSGEKIREEWAKIVGNREEKNGKAITKKNREK